MAEKTRREKEKTKEEVVLFLQLAICHPGSPGKRAVRDLRSHLIQKKQPTKPALGGLDRQNSPRQIAGASLVEDDAKIIALPTIYIKRPAAKKPLMQDYLNTSKAPIVTTVENGSHTSHFIKGLKSEHTTYYFEDIPIPYTLKSCEARLDKLPTMVTKGSGLGGAIIYHLPQKQFQSTMGFSTNGGTQQVTNFHAEKNNHFFKGALTCENDGGWNKTPSRYRQLGVKDQVATMEGVFQTGHQNAEQTLTISSANQYLQNTYDDIYNDPIIRNKKEHERFFNLFGVGYTRKNWHVFSALHTIKTLNPESSATRNVVLTAGAHKTEASHNFGFFTQQINNHTVYRYDIYGGKKVGPFYPSMRVIKTENQILCPFEVTVQLAKPLKMICGSVYYLPNEFQLFDPQYGNSHLKTEHNYHCHIVHNFEKSYWTIDQTFFLNHITDVIDFDQTYKNRGTLNSVGLDQSIGYNGFDRYKIGCAHTYCMLDGSNPALNRPAWKFLIWQRFYLSENCFLDLQGHFTGTYLSPDRIEWDKHTVMPGMFLLDVSTTHVINKNWTVLCEVKNLTNHLHEAPHGYLAKGIEAWVRFVYTI
jgi:hypothetical protein